MPPRRKKFKKTPTQQMTEEERLAYEEQQRLILEELRKKKENILVQFLKDKLSHEERITRYNMLKLNIQWREIMKTAKTQELKGDILILSQTFERIIDCKDAMIKTLYKEIIEAEEMYAMALRSHLQVLDSLLDLQKKRVESFTYDYCLTLKMICDEFDNERAIIIEQHINEINGIDDILFVMEKRKLDEDKQAQIQFESADVDIKIKSLEYKQALRQGLETRIEELWQQFRHYLHACTETNLEDKTEFEALKLKDEKTSQEIEINMRRIQRLEKEIALLREKMAVRDKDYMYRESRIVDLDDEEDDLFNKAERMNLMAYFWKKKAEINKTVLRFRESLTRLSTQSNETIKKLKYQREKGLFVLKMANMCQKLETNEEKIFPFLASSLTKEEEESVKTEMSEMSETNSSLLADIMHECSGLENFWKRYNKVMLDKLALEKEKRSFSQENQELRILLKQYMDAISVNTDTFQQQNPLLMASSRIYEKLSVPGTNTDFTLMSCGVKDMSYGISKMGFSVSEVNIDANKMSRGASETSHDVKKPAAPKTVIEAAHIIKNTLK